VNHADAPLAGAAVEDVAQHHRRRARQQRGAEQHLDVLLRFLGITQQVQDVGAEERHRHGAEHQPPDEAQVDRPSSQMHARAKRTHHHRRDQVAGDRR
jgi:hypothetical protein